MQTRKIISISVILLGLFLLNACEYEKITPDATPVNPNVSFSKDIQPIFTNSCLGSACHSGSVAPNLTEGKSYSALQEGNYIDLNVPNQSKIYTVMAPGGSMSNHTTPTDASLVLQWIEQGAKNN